MTIQVVAFNGSPRSQGNTYFCLQLALEEMSKEGIHTEIIQLGGSHLHGCRACAKCYLKPNFRCAQEDDEMNFFIEKAFSADGILIGSPVYFSNVSTEVKAFIDRCGMVAKANNDALRDKAGAPVIVMRRAGASFAYSAVNFFFGISQMIVPCSNYWNVATGLKPGDAKKDEEGMETFRVLGQNMAKLLKKLA